MLFPRFLLLLVGMACGTPPSTPLLLSQGGGFKLRGGGRPWLLQQHNSSYQELHHVDINHILHWLMSLWTGMASQPAEMRLLVDKMAEPACSCLGEEWLIKDEAGKQ